ncbi:hypothetical protein HZA43_00825 [Candidatus Peregrinibacteria bacterium]|nr:hypothetical protein [Candidatus Peregrinibacteria bacterium]
METTPNTSTTSNQILLLRLHRRNRMKKIAMGFAAVFAVVILGYFGVTNVGLFRAALVPMESKQSTKVGLYIPDYTASSGDANAIQIKAKDKIQNVLGLSFKLTYNPRQITFADTPVSLAGTPLSAFFVQANTAVSGELSVLIVGSAGATIPEDSIVANLNVKINDNIPRGTDIALTPHDVELSVDDSGTPIINTAIREIAAGKISIGNDAKLQALYAEAMDATTVTVHFSDFLRAIDEHPASYTINPLITFKTATRGTDQKSVTLKFKSSLNPGQIYKLTFASTGVAIGNTQGSLADGFKNVFFAGPDVNLSAVQINSVDAVSATQIRVRFSGDVASSTLTPVNFSIHTAASLAKDVPALNVTNVVAETPQLALLTTDRQQSNINYFVVVQNIKDAAADGGKPLGNARIANFIGFRTPTPTLQNVTPTTLTNESDATLTINGSNLDRVAVIRLGATELQKKVPQSDPSKIGASLEVTVPKSIAPGIYNLTLTGVDGDSVSLASAVLIAAPEQKLRVVSDESHAVPLRVPNDGATKTTFWVLIEDPRDIANIERVTIDLTQVGGAPAQVMIPSNDNKTDRRQWFTFQTAIPTTVATSNDPYSLPVTVKNRSQAGEAQGTATVVVTRNVNQGIAPKIDQVYVSPLAVPPDGKTQARVSAKITEDDGIATIVSVVADLGKVGGGFVSLKPTAAPTGTTVGQLNTGWYVSDPFTVSATTPVGNYKIGLTVSNSSGGAAGKDDIDFSVSSTLSGPTIDPAQTYIGPKASVAKTAGAAFSIHAFISDPDTLADIASVIVNLKNVGGGPVPLTRDGSSADTARSGWFSVNDLKVSNTTSAGVQTLEVIATDKSGARSNLILQLDITEQETQGSAPRVKSDKSYTTPRVAVNDGQTKVTLYAFVSSDDDNVRNVVVKLNGIGHVGATAPQTLKEDASADSPDKKEPAKPASAPSSGAVTFSGSCPTVGNIVCMTPSVKEGSLGQWYVLPDVVIDTTTDPSTTPYSVEVIATDSTGKVGRGTIPVYVNNGSKYTNDTLPPEIQLAVATSPTTVEILFNEELDATGINSNGQGFTITDRNDIQKILAVKAATINATGNIVTLTTDPQEVGKYYVLSGSSKIRDAVGVPMVSGGKNRVLLTGFQAQNLPPTVEYIGADDAATINVEFRYYLRPSSLILTPNNSRTGVTQDQLQPRYRGSHDFNVEVYESDSTVNQIPVESVQFGNKANILLIKTDPLIAGKGYRVNFKDLASFDGVKSLRSINKLIKGAKTAAQAATGTLTQRADLNGDGKVDFLDFTMFSAVYGQEPASLAPASTGNNPAPITPAPDSAVPHSSSAGTSAESSPATATVPVAAPAPASSNPLENITY